MKIWEQHNRGGIAAHLAIGPCVFLAIGFNPILLEMCLRSAGGTRHLAFNLCVAAGAMGILGVLVCVRVLWRQGGVGVVDGRWATRLWGIMMTVTSLGFSAGVLMALLWVGGIT